MDIGALLAQAADETVESYKTENMKKNFDKKVRFREFEPGQTVWIRDYLSKKHHWRDIKLQRAYQRSSQYPGNHRQKGKNRQGYEQCQHPGQHQQIDRAQAEYPCGGPGRAVPWHGLSYSGAGGNR